MAGSSLYINGTYVTDIVLDTFTVTSTGLLSSGYITPVWTYSGSGTFLGFSTTSGATTPDSNYVIGSTFTPTSTLYLYSVEGGGITDLTGTTWSFAASGVDPSTMPYSTSYLQFYIDGILTVKDYSIEGNFDYIVFADYMGRGSYVDVYVPDPNFNFQGATSKMTITGGTDATNSDLITWLQANATQVISSDPFTVTYNNSEIYSTDEDATVTLSCANKLMASDITVTGSDVYSVNINYNGSTITTATGSFTKTLSCAGKIMSTDIVMNIVISNYDYDLTGGSLTIFSAPYTFENGVITI